jgi:hypothetical protein
MPLSASISSGVLAFAAVASLVALVLGIIAVATNPRTNPSIISSKHRKQPDTFAYYLSIDEFIGSFITIPTSNLSVTGTTVSSSYLAGRAKLFNEANVHVGTCSASFLNMQVQSTGGIFTDISNYIQTVDGLIVTWFTPTSLVNLALDTLINGLVTEAIVTVTTKVGASRYFGKTYIMDVSSDGTYVHFSFTEKFT